MFDKILIANRGEIACRVMRTAREMGIATVAVYSDADVGALHVALADEAVRIGPPPAAQSYLDGQAVIAAARATGARAIHPGYGFLSENPDFVEAVTAAGLVFIGPSADAIRAMGLKDRAKALMAQAGVPVVPGYHGADQDDAHLLAEAQAIGAPLLIKAVAGGGGKGMRLVTDLAQMPAALAAARREAAGAFGNNAVLLEKFITRPRHIEVQVFGDGTRAVHLFERDCSVQRRHQKVLEEAPAPGMTPEVRAAMGAAAVRAAEAIGYAGAGTVEFIVDGSGALRSDGFWFMEMNTRLQVEHPVTEAVTGIDLVAWQLRVAAGGALPLTQDQITCTGHAIEARIYAEDAAVGFLPATGVLEALDFGADLRVDSGVRAGDAISPYYDPMIAKVIAHGPDRAAALGVLRRGLGNSRVAGTVTNLGVLTRLLRTADFVAGTMDTGLIEAAGPALVALPEPALADWGLAALLGLGLPEAGDSFTLWGAMPAQVVVALGEEQRVLTWVQTAPGVFEVSADGQTIRLHGITWDGVQVRVTEGAHRRRVTAHVARPAVTLTLDGHPMRFHLPDPLARSGRAEVGSDVVIAPMPGSVLSVSVAPGDTVAEGQPLLVLEAMKMEHVLRAPRVGTLSGVSVGAGDQVAQGDVLVEMAPGEGDPGDG